MRAGRRDNVANGGAGSRHDAGGDPHGGASERQDGNQEEPAAANATAAVDTGDRRQGEARARGYAAATAGGESGSH